MEYVLPSLWFFLLGTCIGSFLNVLADRLPEGKDVIFTHSSCGACGTRLRWYDLIPVWSFVFLRGKCRYCGSRLSPQYLLSEIAVGLLYTAGFLLYAGDGNLPRLLGNLFLWSVLYTVGLMDAKTGMILDLFPGILAVFGIVFGLWNGRPLLQILLGGAAGAGCFALVYLISKLILKREGLGLGDVFLLGGIGCWLPWGQVLILPFLAAYAALLFLLILLLQKKKIRLATAFPFGPALCTAAFLLSAFGTQIMQFLARLTGL